MLCKARGRDENPHDECNMLRRPTFIYVWNGADTLFALPSSQCHLGFEALHAAIIRKICEKWQQQQKTIVGYIAHERNINAKINRKFIVIILIWSRCSRQPVSQLPRRDRAEKKKKDEAKDGR